MTRVLYTMSDLKAENPKSINSGLPIDDYESKP
jgi:hypothetical protein